MINRIMIKGMVASLALTGSLAVAPAALAAPADPAGAPTGYGLLHAGHDHDKPKPDKPKSDKKSKHSDHDDHKNKKKGNSGAHAGGGYDSHRHHPRNW